MDGQRGVIKSNLMKDKEAYTPGIHGIPMYVGIDQQGIGKTSGDSDAACAAQWT